MEKWIINEKNQVLQEKIFTLAALHCYHPVKKFSYIFHTLETNDWINVVACTETGGFIFVRQHRLGTDELTLETPAGLINDGETPDAAALRELREETGYEPGALIPLKTLSANPAIMNNYIHFYFARDCRRVAGQKLDQAEHIEIIVASRDETLSMIQRGAINHAIVITALSLFFLSPHCSYPANIY